MGAGMGIRDRCARALPVPKSRALASGLACRHQKKFARGVLRPITPRQLTRAATSPRRREDWAAAQLVWPPLIHI